MDIDYLRTVEGRHKNVDKTMKMKIAGTINAPRKQNDVTISAMDLDSEEELLICAGFQGGVSVVRVDSLKLEKLKSKTNKSSKEHRGINNVQWCCIDSRMFLTSTIDNSLTMWDSQKMTAIKSKKLELKNSMSFHWNQYHATNPMVAIADATKNIQIVDFRVGWEICQDIRATEKISNIRWFPSGRHLLYTCDLNGNISVFDVRSARQTLMHKKVSSRPIQNLRLTSDGLEVISIDNQSNISLMDSITLEEKSRYEPEDVKFPTYFEIFESSSNYVLVSTGGIDLKMIKMDGAGIEVRPLKGHMKKTTCSTFLSRNNELITGCTTYPLVVWSTNFEVYKDNVRMDVDTWSDEE